MSIVVLGAGAWGTALAAMLASWGGQVTLWGRNSEAIKEIRQTRRNGAYLGEVDLPASMKLDDNLEVVADADCILCVTPAQSFSTLMGDLAPLLNKRSKIVLCAKGIDRSSGRMLHAIAQDHVEADRIAALSGPSFARDVVRGLPTAVALAAHDMTVARDLAKKLSMPTFRIYASDDLTGVEIGGALKNVMAIAVGVVRGLDLGASAEAALIARGFAELTRIAVAQGARAETLVGLSGLGDLVLTCSSPQSRNFSYGMALARGEDLLGRPLAEGVHTAEMALKLAVDHGIEAPITEAVVSVLAGKLTARDAAGMLLSRPLRNEA